MNANDIKKVACMGAGVIGSSWATGFAMKGYPVVVCDISEAQLADAKKFIEKNLAYLVEKNIKADEDANKALSKVDFTTE